MELIPRLLAAALLVLAAAFALHCAVLQSDATRNAGSKREHDRLRPT